MVISSGPALTSSGPGEVALKGPGLIQGWRMDDGECVMQYSGHKHVSTSRLLPSGDRQTPLLCFMVKLEK